MVGGIILFLAGENQGIEKLHQNTQRYGKVIKNLFSNVSGSQSAASASLPPGNLLETQILRPHPGPAESECLGIG